MPRPTERNLQAFGRLIAALWRRHPALLPARFGTFVRDLSELELILSSRQRSLRRGLRGVRGRAQMTIRVLEKPGIRDQRLEGKVARSPILDPRSPGRSYLRRRARDAQRARHVAGFAPVRRAVRRWVRAERVEKSGRIATIYHLVPRGAVEGYRRALERAAHDAGVRLLISGPWPAYAFADGW